MLDGHAVRLCLLIASELVFMGKEKVTKDLMWLMDDFDASNAFPWGEYMWDKFYQRTINVDSKHTEHHLAELNKKPNFNATYNLYGFVWAFKVNLCRMKARVNGIEHYNRMCGDAEVDMCTENQSTDLNQKNYEDMPNFCSNHNDTSNHIGRLSIEAKASSFFINPGNDKDASHLDDLMEIDGENVKDGYTNSQDHLHILIKALEPKTENPTLDLVVPPKDDDCILRTYKPNDAYDVVEDDYMLLLNDEEKPVKSSLNDMELEQEPDKIDVKQGILEQQPNAPKGKTTIFEETIEVKVKEKHGLGRGVGPLKVKKKNFQRALRPNYHLRSAKDRKKQLAMALKPPFGQQSATTLHLDLWIDLMWSLRPPVVDLDIVSPHFSTCILSGMISDYISNGHMYRLPWQAVEKAYFSVNEPKTHWCLAELEIPTGVVTFYDSLGWAGRFRRRWWRRMKKLFPEKLTVYLVMLGILESKGISADDYKITYKYVDPPFQASLFGDCGIWVCIFIYRLCSNLPLTVDDHLETALA
nr:phospholipase-like protein [Tanacetum cinerariifolium]GEV16428.1 phospholipase-like protein [Tanacetum cinerariifolium]